MQKDILDKPPDDQRNLAKQYQTIRLGINISKIQRQSQIL